ncbi:hypothetical protein Slit_2305 [Sideroxydans lithotrophicus ES-1]|uniref:Transposase IS200-like domain-containing protein n=2 Tax=Sideroxydans TaxID=314343 RepID=D5CLT7_SIDLE|nr:hypothetical protein Slit_2305 [Sideroxydans lithotrophicus ES-1]
MTNHVHLLVTSERADGIAKMMQSIGQRFWVLNGRIKMRNPFILDVRLRKAKNRAGMAKTRFQPNLVERS